MSQYVKLGFHLFPILIEHPSVLAIVAYLNMRSHGLGFRWAFNKTKLAKVLNIPRRTFFRSFDIAMDLGLIFKVTPTDEELNRTKNIKEDLVWIGVRDLNASAWPTIPYADLDQELEKLLKEPSLLRGQIGTDDEDHKNRAEPSISDFNHVSAKLALDISTSKIDQNHVSANLALDQCQFGTRVSIYRTEESKQKKKEECAIAHSPLLNTFSKEEKDQDLGCSNDMDNEISNPMSKLSIKIYDINNIDDIDLDYDIVNDKIISNTITKEEIKQDIDNSITYNSDILPLAKDKEKDFPPTPLRDPASDIAISDDKKEYVIEDIISKDDLPSNVIDIRQYIRENIIPNIIPGQYNSVNEREMMLDFIAYKYSGLISDSKPNLTLASVCTSDVGKINSSVLNTVLSDQEFLEKFRLEKLQEQVSRELECQAGTGKGDSMTIDNKQARKESHRKESQAKALATITKASVSEPDPHKLYLRNKLAEEKETKALAAKAKFKAKATIDAKGLVNQCASLEEIQSKVDHYTVDLVYAYLEKEVNDKGKRIPKLTARDRGMLNNFIKNCNNENLDVLKMVKTSLEVLERKKKVLCIDELCKSWIWNEAFDLIVNTKATPKVSELNVRYV